MRGQDKLVAALAVVFAGLMLHSLVNRGPKSRGQTAQYWANQLTRGSTTQESAAAAALLELGPEVSVPVLKQVLESQGPPLYRHLWPKLPAGLRTRLPDPLADRQNRYRAALVLGEFGPAAQSAVPQLTAALHHKGLEGQSAAAALGKIGADAWRAVPDLEAMAKDTNNHPSTIRLATAALERIAGGRRTDSPGPPP